MARTRRYLVPNLRLRAIRESRSESRREFARALRNQAEAMGENLACDERRVARWERGEVRWPRSAYRRVLAALLGMPVEQLGFQPPEGVSEAMSAAGEPYSRTPMVRRADLWDGPPAVTQLPAQRPRPAASDVSPSTTPGPLGPTRDTGPGTLESLEGSVDDLCRGYGRWPVDDLAAMATKRLRLVTGLLDNAARPAERRRLLVAAGWLSAVLACVHFDVGERHRAESLRQSVRDLAAEAGHYGELTAWAWEMAAWFAVAEGRFGDAIETAQAGETATGDTPVGARLALHEAKAAARLRRRRRAEEALERARSIVDRLPWPPDEDHHFAMDEPRLLAHSATAYLWLGDDSAAEDCAWQVLVRQLGADGSTRQPMRIAEMRLTLGVVAARRQDLEQAAYFGVAALQADRMSLPTMLARAAELEAALVTAFPGERATDEFCDRLADLRRRRAGPSTDQRRDGS